MSKTFVCTHIDYIASFCNLSTTPFPASFFIWFFSLKFIAPLYYKRVKGRYLILLNLQWTVRCKVYLKQTSKTPKPFVYVCNCSLRVSWFYLSYSLSSFVLCCVVWELYCVLRWGLSSGFWLLIVKSFIWLLNFSKRFLSLAGCWGII